MKRSHLLAAAALFFPVVASAQDSTSMDMSLRLGLFYPSDSTTQAAGKNWLSFGADFKLFNLSSNADGSRNRLQLSADLLQKADFRSVPITLNYVNDSSPLYFFGGAGASFARYRNVDNELEENILFAYQVGLGYKLGQVRAPVFIEVKWMGTNESRLNGWGAFLGIKF